MDGVTWRDIAERVAAGVAERVPGCVLEVQCEYVAVPHPLQGLSYVARDEADAARSVDVWAAMLAGAAKRDGMTPVSFVAAPPVVVAGKYDGRYHGVFIVGCAA